MNDRESIEAHLRLVATLDPVAYTGIWAADARLEMPLHPNPAAWLIEGRVAVVRWMKAAMADVESLRWIEPVITATEVEGRSLLEVSSETVRSDGDIRRSVHVVIAEVRDGLTTRWREYCCLQPESRVAGTYGDIATIQQLVAAFNHCLDFGAADGFGALFVDGGVLDLGDLRIQGKTALVAFAADVRDRGPTSRHVVTNTWVQVDGDRATAHSYVQVF